jgi:hypothetical protein
VSPDSPTRTQPLSAPPSAEPVVGDGPETSSGERQRRFRAGLARLRTGTAAGLAPRALMILGGILAPVGIIVLLLGWWGASQTSFVFEQVPYLISGGLLGVALVFLGAFLYFTHWLTELVREHRTQSREVVDALQRLQDQIVLLADGQTAAAPAQRGNGRVSDDGDLPLVATARGTMAHRPDCVVVAGKSGLRTVTPDDGLTPCKLCG